LELLKSATFFIDAAYAKDGDAYAFNKGTGGFALHARYGSSLAVGASDTNDPLLLPFNGETYVYLPGSASNTIACTAPVGTASFAAYPTGGGTATTGAAVAGAFTLQTTGSWTRVDILDAGAAVIASFVAANSTSTGYTDAFAVVWTINRSTAGRKSSLVIRNKWLFGTDDYMEVPNDALLNMDASQSFTVVAVVRQWATPAVGGGILGKYGTGLPGYDLTFVAANKMRAILRDGTVNTDMASLGPTLTLGLISTVSMKRDTGADTWAAAINGTEYSMTDVTTGTLSNSNPFTIGRRDPSTYTDIELLAVAVCRRALTATEIASINTYYGTA
jgi:hypothetical protein